MAASGTPDPCGGISALDLKLVRSTVSQNRGGYGGGISSGDLEIVRSTISGNRASVAGGGISTDEARVERSTISGNQARREGGGIAGGSSVRLSEATVTDNAAPAGANVFVASSEGFPGVVGPEEGAARLRSTIVSNPRGGGKNCSARAARSSEVLGGDGSRIPARLISLGHNLEDGDSRRLDETTDEVHADPRLARLADYGGPTETHALARRSPAVDRGASGRARRDQRGARRVFDFLRIPNARRGDGSDVGAFELTRRGARSP